MKTDVSIGEIVKVVGGGTPRKSIAKYYGGSIPWVTPKDMKQPVITSSEVLLTEDGVRNSPAKLIPAESVLVVVRSGVLKHTLPVALTKAAVTVNQDMKALVPTNVVYPPYLARLVKALQPTVLSWVRATTADNFPIDSLLDLKVKLPSLDEQRRIAAILDRADSLRYQQHAAVSVTSQLSRAVFLEMFGDPVANQSGWQRVRVQEVCTLVRGSSPRPQGDPRYFGGPVPRLMISDITRDGKLVTPRTDSLTIEGAKRSRPCAKGTVVMAVSGNIGLVSQLAIDACIHDGFVGFTELKNDVIHPRFLLEALDVSKRIHETSTAGAIFKNITTTDIKALELVSPPIEIQDEYCSRVTAIEKMVKVQHTRSMALEQLFGSLQSRVFSGQL